MNGGLPVLSLVLHSHIPFIPRLESSSVTGNPGLPGEEVLFESLSETWLPLLELFDRLDRDMVPFRLGLSLSPICCHILSDMTFINHYLEYLDRQIEFGRLEIRRARKKDAKKRLAAFYRNRFKEHQAFLLDRWEKNILKALAYYQRRGRLELLTTGATHAFLPFYTAYPEAIQAQFEVAISSFRHRFGESPQGFWLPELGWAPELDPWLRSYNLSYTILESHGLVLGKPFAKKGTFYPARTPLGICLLGRDFYACQNIQVLRRTPVFRDNQRDVGYELPMKRLQAFLNSQVTRRSTGYRYYAGGIEDRDKFYDLETAQAAAREGAEAFLNIQSIRLREAARYMEEVPLCLLAFPADTFGRAWFEGPAFLEALFRGIAKREDLQVLSPAEYLCKQDVLQFQTLVPEFSSWGVNGYGEPWLDASNDWMYRHGTQALERMREIAERFPNATGLRERMLNQAAREILLAISSDWSQMLAAGESSEYARGCIEESLRNFTTLYEALGSSYVSTDWFTKLEKQHHIFPRINYRVFRRKT